MTVQPEALRERPPQIMAAFVAGFNTVAEHLYLLFLPVMIDLILWFAPRLRIEALLAPQVRAMLDVLQRNASAELSAQIQNLSATYQTLLHEFNLLQLIETFPIGVPSLLAGRTSQQTPLGDAVTLQLGSFGTVLGIAIIVMGLGFLLGCVYYALLAYATTEGRTPFNLKILLTHQVPAALIFVVLLFFLVAMLFIPAMLFVSFVTWIAPWLGSIIFFLSALFVIWLLLPLVFTPHGIFASNLSPIAALLNSLRLVRFFLPGTGLFLLIALVISQGLDLLWSSPPTSSWLTLVGIFGHAFIYSALFAASFVYYRRGMQWMFFNLQRRNNLRTAA